MSKAAIVALAAWTSCQAGRAEPPYLLDPTPPAAGPVQTNRAAPARECLDEPGMVYVTAEVRTRGWEGRHRYTNGDGESEHVELAPFWLDRVEVTVEEFRACVDAGACDRYLPRADLVCTWNIRGVPHLPINCVDGEDADAYCEWRQKRLPLGYEWTWAAQGRDVRRTHPWGDAPASCEITIASAQDNADGCDLGRPWPVGSRPRDVSRDGALDLGGNVSEIVLDRMPDDPPFDGRHVEFGGSWETPATNYNSMHDTPLGLHVVPAHREGFRCARDPGPLPPCSVAE